MTAVPSEMTVEFHSGRRVCSNVNTELKLSNVGLSGILTPTVAAGSKADSRIQASGTRNVTPIRPRTVVETHLEGSRRGDASAARSRRVGRTASPEATGGELLT